MIENRDGSFEKPEAVKEILEKFKDGVPDTVKAVHFGTFEELKKKATEREVEDLVTENELRIQEQINELVKRVNKIMIHLDIDDKSEILIV